MIAMEMGAPDPISDEEIAEAVAEQTRLQTAFGAACGARIGRAKDCARTGRRAGAADSTGGSTVPASRRRTRACAYAGPLPTPAPAAPTGMSLGSTIIASGMLRKPAVPANDPLAPIRRMSQAEKIAFFS